MQENLSIGALIYQAFENMSWIEIGAVISGLIYVILAAYENILCWFFGIIGSLLSIYLFYSGKLYAESALYLYYVIAGFYGWYAWSRRKNEEVFYETESSVLKIHTWKSSQHLQAIGLGIILALVLAWSLKTFTDAQLPLIDAFTTIFSFIATYMVTRKILENWLYWIFIDLVTAGMYFHREYYLYALLMIIYTVIAIVGYLKWKDLQQKDLNYTK